MKPVMLLDIDGVLNAMSKEPPTYVWAKDKWVRAKITGWDGVEYPFLWAQPVVEWLINIHYTDQAEIRWHTTWNTRALEVGNILGLPEFGVQESPEFEQAVDNGSLLAAKLIREGKPSWWKYPAAERILTEEKRRVIWIDDDIDYQLSNQVRRNLGLVHELLLVCPAEATGIISKHMNRVETKLAIWGEEPYGAFSGS